MILYLWLVLTLGYFTLLKDFSSSRAFSKMGIYSKWQGPLKSLWKWRLRFQFGTIIAYQMVERRISCIGGNGWELVCGLCIWNFLWACVTRAKWPEREIPPCYIGHIFWIPDPNWKKKALSFLIHAQQKTEMFLSRTEEQRGSKRGRNNSVFSHFGINPVLLTW